MSDKEKVVLDIDLSDPGPLSDEVINDVTDLLKSGRLHRYGEFSGTIPHVSLLEEEFAQYVGSKYTLGVNSGGCAIYLALKSLGIGSGDKVLVNAFNLAPVPGAIHHAGASAVLVEIDNDLRISLSDLEFKAEASEAKVLLLTHMRGHIANMDKVMAICKKYGLLLVEDCAHTMGAKWNGKFTGTFGKVGCFSTQTFKHINSGEGGLLSTDDDDVAARAILSSGSYMLYSQHCNAPPLSVFEKYKYITPNLSMRMSNLVACVLRPQLREMNQRGDKWNSLYTTLAKYINEIEGLHVPLRESAEEYVASSIQFQVTGLNSTQLQSFTVNCTKRGVALKWFGREHPVGYTSQYSHWEYLEPQHLPNTTNILTTTCDMRIPLSLTEQHCGIIATVMEEELRNTLNGYTIANATLALK